MLVNVLITMMQLPLQRNEELGFFRFSLPAYPPPYLNSLFFLYGFEYKFLPWNWLLARHTGYTSRGRIGTTRICVKSPPSKIFRGTIGYRTLSETLRVGNVWYIVSNNDNCDWLLLGVEREGSVISKFRSINHISLDIWHVRILSWTHLVGL